MAVPSTGAADVGDVPAAAIQGAATLVFAAVIVKFELVTWQIVKPRLRPSQNQASMIVALEVLRKQGALEMVERLTVVAGEGEGVHEQPGRKKRRCHQLAMSNAMDEPCVSVKRGGQESFPSFKMKPLCDWPASNPVLDAIKAEHNRREQSRQPASNRST